MVGEGEVGRRVVRMLSGGKLGRGLGGSLLYKRRAMVVELVGGL